MVTGSESCVVYVFQLTVFTIIFSLPFEDVPFFGIIVRNSNLDFKKKAGDDILKNPSLNRTKFMLKLVAIVLRFFDLLTSEERKKILIFDETSTYDRSRSKKVDLLAWICDNNSAVAHRKTAMSNAPQCELRL